MNTYGIYPAEETFFKDTIVLAAGTQLSVQQNTDDPLRLKVSKEYNTDLHHLLISLPLQYTTYSNGVLNFSLTNVNIEDILKNIKLYMPKHIILSGASSYIRSYNDYKAELQDYISKINAIPYTKIVLKNDTYLKEILNDSASYAVESFTSERYGVCVHDNFALLHLLNYKINIEVLRATTDKINLSLETDCICTPYVGVSNTLESVLWLLDFLFQVKLSNIYSTTVDTTNNSNNIFAVLAYQYATQDSSVLYNTTMYSQNITYYLTKNIKKNIYYLTVINKDKSNNTKINFKINLDLDAILYRLLSNQGAGGTGGISFGELLMSDGILKNVRTGFANKDLSGITLKPRNNMYSFIVPKLSAVVLTVPCTINGGAFFEDINDAQESDTVITVQPDIYDMNAPLTMSVKKFKQEYNLTKEA